MPDCRDRTNRSGLRFSVPLRCHWFCYCLRVMVVRVVVARVVVAGLVSVLRVVAGGVTGVVGAETALEAMVTVIVAPARQG